MLLTKQLSQLKNYNIIVLLLKSFKEVNRKNPTRMIPKNVIKAHAHNSATEFADSAERRTTANPTYSTHYRFKSKVFIFSAEKATLWSPI